MASTFIRKDRKKKFGITFFDPAKQKRVQKLFASKVEQKHWHTHWQMIENKYYNNDPTWKDSYEEQGDHITLAQLFNKYKSNKLNNMLDPTTKRKYLASINSCLQIFGDNQIVHQIRTLERNGKLGWEIYKSEREALGRSRNGINSYMQELKVFFEWAKRRELIDKDIIIKDDFFQENEIAHKEIKKWTEDEIHTLHTHPDVTEFEKDMMFLYIYTGFRANAFLGSNKDKPWQEFHWQHVDFDNGYVYIDSNKKKKKIGEREQHRIHPSAWAILKKWKDNGNVKPIPMTYSGLKKIIARISKKTKIQFTHHDLRRLHGQLAELYFHSMDAAQQSLGHTNSSVTRNHYVKTSDSTQDYINDGVAKQFHHKR